MKTLVIAAILLSAPAVFGQTTIKKENGGVVKTRPVEQQSQQNSNEQNSTPTLNSGEKQMRTENPNNQNNVTPINSRGTRPMVRSKEVLKNPEQKEN